VLAKQLTEREVSGGTDALEVIVFTYIRLEMGTKLLHLQRKENGGNKEGEGTKELDPRIANHARKLHTLLEERKPSQLDFILHEFFFFKGSFPQELRSHSWTLSQLKKAFLFILERLYDESEHSALLHKMHFPFEPDELNDMEKVLQSPKQKGPLARTLGHNFRYCFYAELAELLGDELGLYECMENILVELERHRNSLFETAYAPRDLAFFREKDLLPSSDKPFFLPNASDEDGELYLRRSIEDGTRAGKRKENQLPLFLIGFTPSEHVMDEEEKPNNIQHSRRRLQPRRTKDIH
jgi:hypothetical protein